MSEIKKHQALEYIVNTLKNAIADSKVVNPSAGVFTIKDGNDEISLRQEDNAILITDVRKIIFSEDLLETLQHIHKNVKGDDELKAVLENTSIIINDLSIESEFIFQAVKDFLDQLSNSYEFVRTIKNNVNQFQVRFKFGKNLFELKVNNQSKEINIETIVADGFDPVIYKTIASDIKKVEQASNKMFKEN